ncbi:hypothetical protein MOB1_06700 [Faecalimonas mobilis]
MKIENKEMLLYSMNKAYEELYETIRKQDKDENEVYFRLGSCLHWIVDCYDRIKDCGITEEDKKIFKAIRAANNAQKHIKELYKLHEVSTGGYPRKYARHYGVKYIWESIEDIPLKHNNEKKSYQELFCGGNIINTLEETKRILERYYKEYDENA